MWQFGGGPRTVVVLLTLAVVTLSMVLVIFGQLIEIGQRMRHERASTGNRSSHA